MVAPAPHEEARRVQLVLPARDEGDYLPTFLRDLGSSVVARTDICLDVVVVDDGSEAQSAHLYGDAISALREHWQREGAKHSAILLTQPSNLGRGAALRRAWTCAHAAAEWIGYVDADGAVPAYEVLRVIDVALVCDAHAVVGTRFPSVTTQVKRSVPRWAAGRAFATLASLSLGTTWRDCQCGLKLFRASALREVLPLLREDRWLFDIETLMRIEERGGRVRECPIDWTETPDTTVRWRDPFLMARGLMALRRRLRGTSRRAS